MAIGHSCGKATLQWWLPIKSHKRGIESISDSFIHSTTVIKSLLCVRHCKLGGRSSGPCPGRICNLVRETPAQVLRVHCWQVSSSWKVCPTTCGVLRRDQPTLGIQEGRTKNTCHARWTLKDRNSLDGEGEALEGHFPQAEETWTCRETGLRAGSDWSSVCLEYGVGKESQELRLNG